jgi:uncharacterized protein (DUF58 family)
MKWYLGAAALLLLALAFQLGLLAYAMYVLLALLIVSRLLARSWVESVTAERECNRLNAEVGDTVAVVVTVRNPGRLPAPWILMEDLLAWPTTIPGPAPLRLKGRQMKISLLWPGGQATMYYQLQFQMRGYYQIGPLVLESGDLFGLHRRYHVATDPHFVLVYPRVTPLLAFDIASRRPIGEVRLSNRIYEDPTRISGIRDYQPGDALNRIHWRATARVGSLQSKTYEPSTVAGTTLLLSFHQTDFDRRHEPYRSELAVTAAASLANAVYQMGQQIGLVTNGRDAAERIREEGWRHDFRTRKAALAAASLERKNDRLAPLVVETRRGAEQLGRVLEMLARVEISDGLTFSQLVLETASRLPRDATVVAILSDVTVETAVALSNLRRRGFALTAILNVYEESDFARLAGRLLAEGIESRHIKNEEGLPALCGRHVLR